MTELRQRRPRVRDDGFLTFVRTKPCCVCAAIGRTQPAHIRMACLPLGKEYTGHREKPDDKWVVPLCGPIIGVAKGCHAKQHSGSEAAFWKRYGLNPFVIAARNYLMYRASKPADTPSMKRATKPKARSKPLGGRGWPKKQAKLQNRGFSKVKRGFRT